MLGGGEGGPRTLVLREFPLYGQNPQREKNKKVEKQKKTVKDVNFPYNPMFLKKNTHLQTRFLTVSALQTSGNNQQLLYPALSLSVVETVEMTLGATAL